jgi:hypothetical protein
MFRASVPAWLECFYIKEKLKLKSDQGISAYFFLCYLIVTVTGNIIFKHLLPESNRESEHDGMSAKHVARHGELENRLMRPQQFFLFSESVSAFPTCSDSTNPRTSGMRKIARRDIENIYRTSRNPRTWRPSTPHQTYTLHARRFPSFLPRPPSCLHSTPTTPSVNVMGLNGTCVY